MADNQPLGREPFMRREFKIGSTAVFEYNVPTNNRWERFKDWCYWVRYFSFGRGAILELDDDGSLYDSLIKIGWMHERKGQLYFTRKGSRDLRSYCRSIMSNSADDFSPHNHTSQ